MENKHQKTEYIRQKYFLQHSEQQWNRNREFRIRGGIGKV